MLISSIIPFAPVSWWGMVNHEKKVLLDVHEHFEKMTFRNRYYLSGAQGKMLLSIPLKNGRNQHVPMQDVEIDNSVNWQLNHWKTIVSLYNRSPFLAYFDYKIQPLFEKKYDKLCDWSMASIDCMKSILNLHVDFSLSNAYQAEYATALDIRQNYHPKKNQFTLQEYPQVFSERMGFIQDCSILDALFCTGKYALEYSSAFLNK